MSTTVETKPEVAANPDLSSAPARAKRLRSLREMTGLSRSKFHERYGIARGTLQNWESARFGGLTSKGAHQIQQAMRAEGIDMRFNWLLHGIGHPPQFIKNQNIEEIINSNNQYNTQQVEVISQELLYFRKHYPDSIDTVITDDSMTPIYFSGDYVAGCRRYREQIEKVIGKNCIVQTPENGTMVRQVKAGDQPGHYNLISVNPHTKHARPVLYNVELISAAPIIWTRRADLGN